MGTTLTLYFPDVDSYSANYIGKSKSLSILFSPLCSRDWNNIIRWSYNIAPFEIFSSWFKSQIIPRRILVLGKV